MRRLRRETALLLGGLLIVVCALSWWSAGTGARVSDSAAVRARTSTTLVASQLQQALAVRQFLLTGDEASITDLTTRRVEFLAALQAARRQVAGHAAALSSLDALATAQVAWRDAAQRSIEVRRAARRPAEDPALALTRERRLDAAVAAQGAYRDELTRIRRSALTSAARRTTALTILACLLLGTAGYVIIRSRVRRRVEADRRRLRFAATQQRLAEAMAIVEDEAEAHDVLRRHLELASDGDQVVVLSRNNSDNRLEATSALDPADPLAATVEEAAPRDCMAIRRAQLHRQGRGSDDGLLRCGICGGCPGATSCQPLLVGGKVIGSVLQRSEAPLDDESARRLRASVESAAPVLAHVRTLAIAETRAATDALTGLANRRAVADSLKRMVAQASRALTPLAVIAIDLDHFKQINDRHGHDLGDDVLAAVGSCLRDSVRGQDLVGRTGGEELVVIAPGTDAEGAAELAEKLREAVAGLTVTGLPDHITASFGVAAMPEHAVSDDALLRRADRALYLAKRNGRDRVEVAGERAASDVMPAAAPPAG